MPKQAKKTEAAEKAAPKKAPEPKSVRKPATDDEPLFVFAFRLTAQERELIHKAAGPGKASRFVRALAVAAASGDTDRVLELLGGPAPAIN